MDLAISNTTASWVLQGAIVLFLLTAIVRFRLFPRISLDDFPIRAGGPWTVTNKEFWNRRGIVVTPAPLRFLGAGFAVLGATFIALDLIF